MDKFRRRSAPYRFKSHRLSRLIVFKPFIVNNTHCTIFYYSGVLLYKSVRVININKYIQRISTCVGHGAHVVAK